MQPGEVVGPGGQLPDEPKEQIPQEQSPAPDIQAVPVAQQEQQPPGEWQFTDDAASNEAGDPARQAHEPVSWSASEYIAHDKNANWYIVLGLAVVLFAGLVYLLTRELISSVVIIIMGVAFGGFAARKPQELTYVLDNNALHVGNKSFSYGQFKSFTVIQDEAVHSITLMPLQRFMPPLSIYFDPSDEEKIVTALSGYIPYEDRKQDFVDRIMRKVRF